MIRQTKEDLIDQIVRKFHSRIYVQQVDTPILKLLLEYRPILQWLNENGPTKNLPKNFTHSLTELENLGIIYRRNKTTLSLRRQRLKKVIEHESAKLKKPLDFESFLSKKETTLL